MTNDYLQVPTSDGEMIVKVERGSHRDKFDDEKTSVVDINEAGNKDEFIWENWSSLIFPGFYDTLIGEENWLQDILDSDQEYIRDCEENGDEVPNYCYRSWEELDAVIDKVPGFYRAYEDRVASYYTKLLWDEVVSRKLDNVITSMQYDHLWSPREYNFYTDRLNIRMRCDWDKMEKFISDNDKEFRKYLKENWTSYDGFFSLVPNTPERLRENSKYREICIEFLIYRIAEEDSKRDEYFDSIEYAVYEYIGDISVADVISWANKSLQESDS